MKIDKDVTIVESAATNARRKTERAAAGLNPDLSVADNSTKMQPHQIGDPAYYALALEGNKYDSWEDL